MYCSLYLPNTGVFNHFFPIQSFIIAVVVVIAAVIVVAAAIIVVTAVVFLVSPIQTVLCFIACQTKTSSSRERVL